MFSVSHTDILPLTQVSPGPSSSSSWRHKPSANCYPNNPLGPTPTKTKAGPNEPPRSAGVASPGVTKRGKMCDTSFVFIQFLNPDSIFVLARVVSQGSFRVSLRMLCESQPREAFSKNKKNQLFFTCYGLLCLCSNLPGHPTHDRHLHSQLPSLLKVGHNTSIKSLPPSNPLQ